MSFIGADEELVWAGAGSSPTREETSDLEAWVLQSNPEMATEARTPHLILAGPERRGRFLAAVVAAGGRRAVVVKEIPPGFLERAERLAEAFQLIEGARVSRSNILRSYILPFVLSYAVLLVVAGGFGVFLARRLARPVEALAAGAHRVAEGHLDTRVSLSGPAEVHKLQIAFNTMVERLAGQKKELARLERQAAWREMARNLAHEIKNPLTPIQLAVQEMTDRYSGSDEAYQRLLAQCRDIVTEEISSLRNLVAEFSQFARLPEMKPASEDLETVVDDVARLYGPERVACETPGRPVTAQLDARQIRRALINLIDNGLSACRVAGRPERVTLSLKPEKDFILLAVSDEGCGIAESDVDKIFDPHFSTRKDGTGLGLAIVEGIIRSHKGSIDVQTEAGRGTVFSIHLPAEATREVS
jgi:nitrogen fixation/metabolism regulation signal transduction histidine kinase